MNAKLQNTALSLDDWIDDDDTPEFSDDYLNQATVKLSQNGQVIAQAKGLNALRKKLVPFDMVKLLDSNEAITEYLAQVLEDGDKTELIHALGYIAKAKGVAFKRERSISKQQGDLRQAVA